MNQDVRCLDVVRRLSGEKLWRAKLSRYGSLEELF
jgi:hypothetical protein